ncbi:lipoprotein-releasing ABC transporter permease subunit [Haematospirillum jordaniae]|uniref:Multidrug ABC transporter substrate-binding protein n=1 Tax=Haematospirillum jordaniae TaxID=1549855 RepID=A0A143DEC3_9PROT|nr:lipoprotein-releasing ABC transporter permease subunit [Haematospirillum jordaniae]AMW35084.1 multidrug ABC transporter substrate-binding protein [Haematospirillum jordaniae]NKD44166.1 lipoprotein-releasing ABC transporter permease subunit [Haematospirillum jordaniae]NKD56544.1 lipoprotein-releasing ABC transporter permease subunit [Haematospirillum jordaniae]NKD58602.1 lipoprotein-releasing ABC transporter permease subunit [Haematospirillum jordaniae]NKD66229.1 lipoprotein-releasing ABC tr
MIFDAFERMVALRYLRARRKEGFVSVIAGFSLLGIALGVATLIIVMAVMNGFRHELLGRILGLNGHVVISSSRGNLDAYGPYVERLRTIPGVTSASPVVEGQVMVSAKGASRGGMVRGMMEADLGKRPVLSGSLIDGNLDHFDESSSILIGSRMARHFGVEVGDSLTLVSPKGAVTAFGTVPRMRAYRIAAIFDVGMHEYDSAFIYMPMAAAQAYFQMSGQVSQIEIMTGDPDNLDTIIDEAYQILGRGYYVADWTRSNASLFNALQVERNVMFLILTLIIIVAAFNIISGLIMLVKDKGRDIAILRTMGATRGSVMRIFFLAGASVGVCGTVSGLVLGVLFCENIELIRQGLQSLTGTDLFSAEVYFLSKMPAKMEWSEVIRVTAMAIALSLGATLYPSWRAARLDPVEALRYE